MIVLHRLAAHEAQPFHLNYNLIVTVEANPDTVITLTTGTKIVVVEPPEEVAELIHQARVDIVAGATRPPRPERGVSGRACTRHASGAALTAMELVTEVVPFA